MAEATRDVPTVSKSEFERVLKEMLRVYSGKSEQAKNELQQNTSQVFRQKLIESEKT